MFGNQTQDRFSCFKGPKFGSQANKTNWSITRFSSGGSSIGEKENALLSSWKEESEI